MRVFIYEALCAGAVSGHSPSISLLAEGRAMLSALVEDFCQIADLEVSILAKKGSKAFLAPGLLARVETRDTATEDEPAAFRELATKADFTLVIAPETDALLFERCQWVEHGGGRLLGPNSQAVRLTADKLEAARHLSERGIATPPCFAVHAQANCSFPAVLKPRFGAGSQATFLIQNQRELAQALLKGRNEGWTGEMLLQPFVAGIPCSVSFLTGERQIEPLLPASQELTSDGRFHYHGGVLPLPSALAQRVIQLGDQAVRAIPGLRGYVGVDLILGEREDYARDQVIEINPRLTTSYVGLRALAKTNLAKAMIDVAEGEHLEALQWKGGKVRFWPDGRMERSA